MKFIGKILKKFKDVINGWINKRLLDMKINKLSVKSNDVVFITLDSEFITQSEIHYLKSTLDGITKLKDNYILIYNNYISNVEKINLNEKDVVLAKIPLETFYLWDRAGDLEDKSSLIKEQFKESGIDNKVVILPDGYEYKQEDYINILNKINETDVTSETIK